MVFPTTCTACGTRFAHLYDSEPATIVGVLPSWFGFPIAGELPEGFGFSLSPVVWTRDVLTPEQQP